MKEKKYFAVSDLGRICMINAKSKEIDFYSLKSCRPPLVSAQFRDEDCFIVTLNTFGDVRLWDFKTLEAEPNTIIKGDGTISNDFEEIMESSRAVLAEFIPGDEKKLVTASSGYIKIWDTDEFGEVTRGDLLKRQPGIIRTVCFSENGELMAVSCSDANELYIEDGKLRTLSKGENVVIVWDVKSGRQIASFDGGESLLGSAISLSPDGEFLITRQGVWDIKTTDIVPNTQLKARGIMKYICDRNIIMIADMIHNYCDISVDFWNLNTFERVSGGTLGGHYEISPALGFSSDGEQLSCLLNSGLGVNWYEVDVYDSISLSLRSRKRLENFRIGRVEAIMPDRNLIIERNEHFVTCYDYDTEKIHFNRIISSVDKVTISPVRNHLLCQNFKNVGFSVFDLDDDGQLPLFRNKVNCVAVQYSGDGDSIFTVTSDGSIEVWDAQSFEKVSSRKLEDCTIEIVSAQISPHYIVAYNDYVALVWDANNLTKLPNKEMRFTGKIESVQISPDERYLISTHHDSMEPSLSATFWDIKDFRKKYSLGKVDEVQIAPKGGKTFVTVLSNSMTLWNPRTRRPIKTKHFIWGLDVHGAEICEPSSLSTLSPDVKGYLKEYGAIVD